MKLLFIISIFLLEISFLLLPKTKEKISLLDSIIYSLGLLYAYQTLEVYLTGLLNIGNILLYSIINITISLILIIFLCKRKQIQKYTITKKELLLKSIILLIGIILVLIRFNGFNSLSYSSDDSSIHYKAAQSFQQTKKYLNKNTYPKQLYDYDKMMPISYINGGFFLYIVSNIPSYKAFFLYDGFCFILYGLLFSITISKLLQKKEKNNILYNIMMTTIYMIGYPFNNLLYGFCYLGLGVMITNLLFITYIENNLNKNILYNLIITNILTFSLFFSYYIFVPPIYLATGLFYLYQKKKNLITTKETLLYITITLIIPFIIGFKHFFYNIGENTKVIATVIKYGGSCYKNITPIYILIISILGFIYYLYKKKKITPNKFLNINSIIFTIYTTTFLILYLLKKSDIYYFYKLFYIEYLIWIIIISITFYQKRKIIYITTIIILLITTIIYYKPDETFQLQRLNIYFYNAGSLNKKYIRYNKEELKILEKATTLNKICHNKDTFIMTGNQYKNAWFYAITDKKPTISIDNTDKGRWILYEPNISLSWWDNLKYECIVYYYENNHIDIPKDRYITLYKNKEGIILKKKEE